MRQEVRLSGSGGQGLLLIGGTLAEALGVIEGKNVVQSNSYGGQVRGGSSRSDVLIAPPGEEIDYPEVMDADILLAMTQEALDEYKAIVKPKGLVVLDTTNVKQIPEMKSEIVSYPFTLKTKERLGTELPTNMVVLAVIVALSKLISRDSLSKAIEAVSPKGRAEMNLKAMNFGFELADTGALQKKAAN